MSIVLWCLFIAGLLHIISRIPVVIAQEKCEGGYDNHSSRTQQDTLTGWGQRARAAHNNQIESFPIFAAGAIVTTISGVTGDVVTGVAIAYIVSRFAYLFFYIKDLATLRSIVWIISYVSSLALLSSPVWA